MMLERIVCRQVKGRVANRSFIRGRAIGRTVYYISDSPGGQNGRLIIAWKGDMNTAVKDMIG